MSENVHTYQANGSATQPLSPLDANTRRAIRSARTRRLKRRLVPFDSLDAEVVKVIERLTPAPDKALGTNTARVIIQAQTLRKELLLGKLKAEELARRIEEWDVREEWEQVKHALGLD
jgi:hypothetical protein